MLISLYLVMSSLAAARQYSGDFGRGWNELFLSAAATQTSACSIFNPESGNFAVFC